MTSAVEICNRAIEAVGHEPIGSLEESSKTARICNRLFPQLRDELTRAHPFNCTLSRATLAALEASPEWGFSVAFQLPADCLKVWRINAHPEADWRVEGRTIVTDLSAPLEILYGAKVEDPERLDPLFVAALAARLAMELAMPIAQSASLRDMMAKEFRDRLRDARSADAQEGLPEYPDAGYLLRARL